jgi:hypothetical protein
MSFTKYIPYTSEYNISNSIKFIKHIFSTKNFEIERYIEYKKFKNKVANNTFNSHEECMEMANRISPGLGMTDSVGIIINELKLS